LIFRYIIWNGIEANYQARFKKEKTAAVEIARRETLDQCNREWRESIAKKIDPMVKKADEGFKN